MSAEDFDAAWLNRSALLLVDMNRSHLDHSIGHLLVEKAEAERIIGRAVIVHMAPDDLKTDPTGNAGGRAACGVIQ